MNKTSITFVLVAYFSIFNAAADDAPLSKDAAAITFNVSIYKPRSDDVKRSALRTLLKLNWTIVESGDSYVVGGLKNDRLRIDFNADNGVSISGAADKWQKKIQRHFLIELASCSDI